MKKLVLSLGISLSIINASYLNYKPNMEAYATARTLNVEVYTEGSEVAQYGVPGAFTTRFPLIASRVHTFYYGAATININFTNVNSNYHIWSSDFYNCLSNDGIASYNVFCQHNGGSSAGLSYVCPTYHNSNINNIRYDFFDDYSYNPLEKAVVILTAGKMCNYTASTHQTINGIHYSLDNQMLVRDYDYTKSIYDYVNVIERGLDTYDLNHIDYATKTLAHEIGHCYGIADHYGTYYGDARDYCIWGYYKETPSVVNNLNICSDCRQTLLNNANNYNHS